MTEHGFERPTAVQVALLDPTIGVRDVLVSSRTGSGKTVAYGLLLAGDPRMAASKDGAAPASKNPRALVITPTRELAQQVRAELDWLLAPAGMRVLSVTGGTSVSGDLRALRAGCDVLVGTPGRINDHLTRGSLDAKGVLTVVLDEADEMLDLGFRDELEAILTALPQERRTLMLSATMPPAAVALSRKYLREPVKLAVGSPEAAHEDISHVVHLVHSGDKLDALVNLLLLAAPDERTMVFVRTRADAADLASQLAELGFSAAQLTGEMQQRDRTQTLDAFRAGRVSALVATDVAARGLDVPEVTRVIHADLPGDAAALTHRSGRTGRAGRKGTSVLLVPPGVRARAVALLGGAKVRANWKPVPGAQEVRAAAEARLRARLAEAATAAPTDEDARLRSLAGQLLEGRDPAALVANLLREVKFDGPCAPRSVQQVEIKPARDPKGFRPGANARGGFGQGPRDRDGGFAAPMRGRDREDGAQVTFRVNFGVNHGATPARLLAMVCRRGKVKGTDVGAISVGERDSTFGVARDIAQSFARAASRPDVREPHVRIEMARQRPRS